MANSPLGIYSNWAAKGRYRVTSTGTTACHLYEHIGRPETTEAIVEHLSGTMSIHDSTNEVCHDQG